jgi:RNA polymerase primary sigma factor
MDDGLGAVALDLQAEAEDQSSVAPEETTPEPTASSPGSGEYDLPPVLLSGITSTPLLSRDEESQLARDVVKARTRIRRVLRTLPRLVNAALPEHGRSVVRPDTDFRERETVTILDYAREVLRPRRYDGRFGNRLRVRTFIRELEAALKNYRTLRDRMIQANLRLVVSLARRYRRPGIAFADIVQEGTIGLIRAVEKYDPSRDVKFSTYAVWWIWQQIGRSGDVFGNLIRTPVHWNQLRRKVGRETQRLQSSNNGDVDRRTLAQASGVDTERFEIMMQSFQCLSLATPLGAGTERTLEELLPTDQGDPESSAAARDLSAQLEAALAQLPEREADILRLRFGTNRPDALTLEEVGRIYGVSRERIRQLEARALKSLLPICELEGLRAYVD